MISGLTGTQTLATLMVAARDLRTQQATLAGQASSGLVSDDIAGLGSAAGAVLRIQPQLSTLAAYNAAITQTQTQLSVSQVALGGMQAIASSLSASLITLQGPVSGDQLQAASSSATAALGRMASLLDMQSAGQYVFAGTASDTPVIDPARGLPDSGLSKAVATALSDPSGDADAAMAGVLAAAATNIPFSTVLTSSAPADLQASTLTGAQTRLATGYVATEAGQAGATSTGSPVRDLIAGLTAVAGLTSAQLTAARLSGVLSRIGDMVSAAGDGLADASGELGQQQKSLTAQASANDLVATALGKQYGTLTDVDLATVATQQAAVQAQLAASYNMIADLRNMSLAAYL